jgi:hypothetical protein
LALTVAEALAAGLSESVTVIVTVEVPTTGAPTGTGVGEGAGEGEGTGEGEGAGAGEPTGVAEVPPVWDVVPVVGACATALPPGMPEIVPVDGSMLSPAGSPVADQV